MNATNGIHEPKSNGRLPREHDERVAAPSWRDRFDPRRRIALVGKAPDTRDQAPWRDESWQIWVLNDMPVLGEAPRWDACFEIHDHPFESQNPHRDWMRKNHGKPIVLNRHRDEVPDCLAYPADDVVRCCGTYFTNSVSLMVAVAVLLQPEEIGLWGINLAQDGEYAHQRPSCEFFLGLTVGRGIKLTIPRASDLLKCGCIYGLETNPVIAKMQVRRVELQQRLQVAIANEQHWATEKLHVEGMLGELRYWDMFAGASQ